MKNALLIAGICAACLLMVGGSPALLHASPVPASDYNDSFDSATISPWWRLRTESMGIDQPGNGQLDVDFTTIPVQPRKEAMYASDQAVNNAGFRLSTASNFQVSISYSFPIASYQQVPGATGVLDNDLSVLFGVTPVPSEQSWNTANWAGIASGRTYIAADPNTGTPASPQVWSANVAVDNFEVSPIDIVTILGSAVTDNSYDTGTLIITYDAATDRITVSDGINPSFTFNDFQVRASSSLDPDNWGASELLVTFGFRSEWGGVQSAIASITDFSATGEAIPIPEPVGVLMMATAMVFMLQRRGRR